MAKAITRSAPPCTVAGCVRQAHGRQLCHAHRKQLIRTGSVTTVRDRGAPRVQLPWRVPADLVEEVRQEADRQGRPPTAVLEDALRAAMAGS